jgi:hypothetical protein
MAQAQTNDADLEALNALAAEQDSGDEVDNDIDVEFEDDSGTDWLEADDKPAAGGDDDDPEGDDGEHEQYSARVQKRIANLTRKQREAERREQAAIEYAKRVQAERDSLRQRTEVLDKGYVSQYEERVTAQLEAARRDYRQAREINDADGEAKALEAINRATYEQQRVQQAKRAQSQAPQYRDDPAPWAQTQQAQPAAREPDPKAQTWAQRNAWFGQDRVLTQTAMAVHQELVTDEGFDPASNDYYNELDKRMKRFLPEDRQARRPGPGQTVAGSQRSAPAGQRGGKQQVKLTREQVAVAKSLGLTPQQYAKEVVKIEQREQRGE